MNVAWAKFQRLLGNAGIVFRDVAHEEGGARLNIIRSVNTTRNAFSLGKGGNKGNGLPTNVFSSPVAKGFGSPSSPLRGGATNASAAAPPAGDAVTLNARLSSEGSIVNANDSSATPQLLTPVEVALVSSQWNKRVPQKSAVALAQEGGGFGGVGFGAGRAAANAASEGPLPQGVIATVPGGYLVDPTHIRPHQNTPSDALAHIFHQHVLAGNAAPALSVASELLQRDATPLTRQLQDYLPHMTLVQMQEVLCVKAPTAATLSI